MSPGTKMKLIIAPMTIIVFAGLKRFLDNHEVLFPTLCIVAFILGFVMLIKWNVERRRGD